MLYFKDNWLFKPAENSDSYNLIRYSQHLFRLPGLPTHPSSIGKALIKICETVCARWDFESPRRYGSGRRITAPDAGAQMSAFLDSPYEMGDQRGRRPLAQVTSGLRSRVGVPGLLLSSDHVVCICERLWMFGTSNTIGVFSLSNSIFFIRQ